MKCSLLVAPLLAAAWFAAAAPQDGGPTEASAVGVSDLAFLSGTWTGGDGKSRWESWYSSPDGGQVLGASKELRDGRVIMIDFEQFQERDGVLRMTPYPFGKRSSLEFTLTEYSAERRRAVFENPANDFPSRFEYERSDDDSLRITLVGRTGAAAGGAAEETPMRQVIALTRSGS
jgi:hypothetical protein